MKSYSTYEAMRPHFEALSRAGYFKIVMKDVSRTKRLLHDCYRGVIWIMVILYNLQYFISVVQARHSTDKMADSLFLLLSTLGCLAKQAAFNLRSGRVEHLLTIVDGPEFAATTPHNLAIMKDNSSHMHRLLKIYHRGIYACGLLFTLIPLMNKALGQEVELSFYTPFDPQHSPVYEIVVIYMSFLIGLQGYANVSQDCTIVSFYAQAKVQVQMLRYDLEHLVDGENGMRVNSKDIVTYEDNINWNRVIQRRLAKCVEHYRLIAWFCKEVQSIFSEAMLFQFLVMAWVLCMTVYKIVGLSLVSTEFVSMVLYLGILLSQLFIFCYYGTQFKYETDFINQSVYHCDWLSVGPAFRRQLVLLMEHCRQPITPSIAYIIPMTLDTFIAVLKSSYTLFTVLDAR